MRNLYGTISIDKIFGNMCIHEHIHYYKLKNRKYGLEIVKKDSTNEENIKVTNIEDITDNEAKIDKVLNDLVIKQIMPESTDVIDDLLKLYVESV